MYNAMVMNFQVYFRSGNSNPVYGTFYSTTNTHTKQRKHFALLKFAFEVFVCAGNLIPCHYDNRTFCVSFLLTIPLPRNVPASRNNNTVWVSCPHCTVGHIYPLATVSHLWRSAADHPHC